MTSRRGGKMNPPTEVELDGLAADAGKGTENQTILDRTPWLDWDAATQEFVLAINSVDNGGDQSALVTLLRSDRVISEAARWFLADLLERHVFKRRPGRPTTPAYDRSFMQWQLEKAASAYRATRRSRTSRADEIESIARAHLVPLGMFEECDWIEKLTDHLDGKRRQSRAVKRRLPPRPKPTGS